MNPAQDRPRGLGRGLSALIGDEAAAVKGEPVAKKDMRSLPVAFLQPGRYQPRMTFDEQPLAELAASIKEKGVLSPILCVLLFIIAADRWYIPYEENLLTAKFGGDYAAYQTRTRRWI